MFKLNDIQKGFLFIWIPVMCIVLGCIYSSIGSTVFRGTLTANKYIVLSFNDVFIPIVIVVIFSFFMFIIRLT